ncbi:Rieske 2Fe-2S domain-containing protein [Natrinema hispanicum]|uniref:Ferredoxin subunit of nitrite reductase or a ring-hydroxylating dioxygenase n=1 Tax=Natrinema hispanicum TaxID=392421 RepID=A0A1I0BFS9_9EURY|nr:Rieske 2Fe-2S domain-containing protein [Natrinema hispanicum]SDC34678.1 Ferredoxin subunit of nitrite reductase or a ring-hydroxylating dioxygenase [Natrinema hispanicum]SET05805.1 Ferredoxin subunit of nitrite reductase or a ring-hydroxylating dioxygenase [Natrinema hispanicum]
MADSVRVTLEGADESTSVRVYGDEGDVSTDDATFRFSIDGGCDEDENEDADSSFAAEATECNDPRRIAPLADIPTHGTLRCEARSGNRGTELILRRVGDDVTAWRNSCPHKPEVRLDPGSGAIIRDEQVVCHEHGARFECGNGVCTAGPCRGDALDAIAVTVRDESVYLTDDRFESCRRLDDPTA